MNEDFTGNLLIEQPEVDTIDTIKELVIPSDEIEIDDDFSYSGYQVVRGESSLMYVSLPLHLIIVCFR